MGNCYPPGCCPGIILLHISSYHSASQSVSCPRWTTAPTGDRVAQLNQNETWQNQNSARHTCWTNSSPHTAPWSVWLLLFAALLPGEMGEEGRETAAKQLQPRRCGRWCCGELLKTLFIGDGVIRWLIIRWLWKADYGKWQMICTYILTSLRLAKGGWIFLIWIPHYVSTFLRRVIIITQNSKIIP